MCLYDINEPIQITILLIKILKLDVNGGEKIVRTIFVAGLVFLIITLTGCNLLPEPVSLIQAPLHTKGSSVIAEDFARIVKKHLPQGTSLYVPNEPIGMNSVIKADLDYDGLEELIAFYKSKSHSENIGVIILQQQGDNWKKIGEISGAGYDISWGSASDVTGDGVPELLLGWKMGVSSGSILEVYEMKKGVFEKLTQLNFHELDLILADNSLRIVTWERAFVDVFDIEIWKWENDSFVQDQELYESYFQYVANYYKNRLDEAPDAAYYYYYLADALLKANQPDNALRILTTGMSLKVTVPPFEEFNKLMEKIKSVKERNRDKDILFYEPVTNITINIPEELSELVSIESSTGINNEYVIHVNNNTSPLFSIELYAKDFVVKEDISLPLVNETEHHYITVRRNHEEQLQIEALVEEMIASIRIGAPFTKHQHWEEEELIAKVQGAYMMKTYVGTGGKMTSETIETFLLDEIEYRYMGTDLDTLQEFTSFLSESFTIEAIQSFLEGSNIIEHNGRLAQPNADGGSLLDYSKANIVQVRDLGAEKQIDLNVPIGNTFTYEIIPVVMMKTEEGWRISSNPKTF